MKSTSLATLPPNPHPQRLRQAARLRTGREFRAVRAAGVTAQSRFFKVTALLPAHSHDVTPGSGLRLGVVTSRRVGPAVTRNRARRHLRELFRRHRDHLPPDAWLVVVARAAIADAEFSEIREEWLRLAKRLSMVRRTE